MLDFQGVWDVVDSPVAKWVTANHAPSSKKNSYDVELFDCFICVLRTRREVLATRCKTRGNKFLPKFDETKKWKCCELKKLSYHRAAFLFNEVKSSGISLCGSCSFLVAFTTTMELWGSMCSAFFDA